MEARQDRRGDALAGLSTAYLLVPVLLFAWGWLLTPYAILTSLIVAVLLFLALRDAWRSRKPFSWKGLIPYWPALLVLAWVLFSGAGGFGYQNEDYVSKNALFRELVFRDWPLRVNVDGSRLPIVYYFGHYLPAAAIGKLLGWGAANACLLLWTAAGALLAWGWFLRLTNADRRRVLPATLLFLLAGGLDLLGYYRLSAHAFDILARLDRWAGILEYSSNTTLLFWVPQHALAAWILAGLLFAALQRPAGLKLLLAGAAAAALTSPFGIIGLLPFLPVLLFEHGKQWKQALTLRTGLFILACAWIGGTSALFLASNQYSFPIGWIWEFIDPAGLPLRMTAFLLLEFGLLAMLVWALWTLEKNEDLPAFQKQLFAAALMTLALLPFLCMGYFNDLSMRASIPALFLFWVTAGRVLLRPRETKNAWTTIVRALCVLLLLVGCAAAVNEIARSVHNYHFGPPDLATVHWLTDRDDLILLNQMSGRDDSLFQRLFGRE